jgi:bacterioferritin B
MTKMIGDDLARALNEQVGHEFAASMQYVSIGAYFDGADLFKLAKLFYDQANEEREHGMKLVDYLVKAGVPVQVPAIPEPKNDFTSAEQAVSLALEWEMDVARQYNGLMDLATSSNDYLSQDFLAWFVTEQLEEVSKMRRLLQVIRRAGANLIMIEAYLSHLE